MLEGSQTRSEVGPFAIEHVAEHDARQASFFGAGPQALGLHLDADHGIDGHEGRLDHRQGGDGVGQEARVSGSVDQVERDAAALDMGQRGRKAQLALLLLVVPVRHGRSVLDFAEAVHGAATEEQRLKERRLACAAVADKCDVPDLARVVHPASPVLFTDRRHVRSVALRFDAAHRTTGHMRLEPANTVLPTKGTVEWSVVGHGGARQGMKSSTWRCVRRVGERRSPDAGHACHTWRARDRPPPPERPPSTGRRR